MPLTQHIEEIKKKFDEEFIEPAKLSFVNSVSDQSAPYKHQLENFIKIKSFLKESILSTLQAVKESLPPEESKYFPPSVLDEGAMQAVKNEGRNQYRNEVLALLSVNEEK